MTLTAIRKPPETRDAESSEWDARRRLRYETPSKTSRREGGWALPSTTFTGNPGRLVPFSTCSAKNWYACRHARITGRHIHERHTDKKVQAISTLPWTHAQPEECQLFHCELRTHAMHNTAADQKHVKLEPLAACTWGWTPSLQTSMCRVWTCTVQHSSCGPVCERHTKQALAPA